MNRTGRIALLSKALFSLLATGLALAAPGAGFESPPLTQNLVMSTLDEIKDDVLKVPCKNSERKNAAIALLERMGAPPSAVQKIDHVENVTLTVPGTGSGKIVVGLPWLSARACNDLGPGCLPT